MRHARSLFLAAISAAFIAFSACKREKNCVIQTVNVSLNSPDDIVMIKDSLVIPYIYSGISGLDELPPAEAKTKFISMLLPSVLVAKYELKQAREKIEKLQRKDLWSHTDSIFYSRTEKRFKAKDIENLLFRMQPLPNSLVLAQAAVESGWGQSRFFREANNVFGIWSYNENEPRIRAILARGNKPVYVKAYANTAQSIMNYFETLGSARAYKELRETRTKTQDPFDLLPHLKYYSEKREAYTRLLKQVIERNNLTQYDHFRIDPTYIVEEDNI